MKATSKHAKKKKHKQHQQGQPPLPSPAQKQPGKLGMPRWVWVTLCCLILLGGGTWAAFEFFVWNKVPPELVGKWEVEGGPMAGGTFEFSRDGTLEMRHRNQGTTITMNGRVAVRGKTLSTTTRNLQTKREETHRSTIQELTPDSLVLELEKGAVLRLVRRK